MMTFENAQGFSEEMDLVELFGLFGFDTERCVRKRTLLGQVYAKGKIYLCRSAADRFDSTVFPMSTISPNIFWLIGSPSVVAALSRACGVRFASALYPGNEI